MNVSANKAISTPVTAARDITIGIKSPRSSDRQRLVMVSLPDMTAVIVVLLSINLPV